MIDWSKVGAAVLRVQGQWWTDAVALATEPDQTWDRWWREMSQRTERMQESMLNEWRVAGVEQPLTMYAMVTESAAALWTLSLMRRPGGTLQLWGLALALGAGYGVYNSSQQRSAGLPAVPATHSTPPAMIPTERRSEEPYGYSRTQDRPGTTGMGNRP